jgi:MFS family permease
VSAEAAAMPRVRSLMPALPRAAWIVLAGDAVSALGSGLTLPFLLVYLHQSRELDLGPASLAVATVAIAGLAGNPLGGALSDRIGARATLAAGLVTAAGGSLALAAVSSSRQAFAACALLGVGAAVAWPALDALLAELVASEQRASAFALRHATMNAGLGIGALIAALVVAGASPTALTHLYVVDAVTFAACAVVLVGHRRLPRAGRAGRPARAPGGYRTILGDRVFVRVWALTALLVTAGVAQYAAAFPAYATEVVGLDAGWLSLALAANTITVVGAQLLALRLLAGRRRSSALVLVAALWAAAWSVALAAGALTAGSAAAALLTVTMVLLAAGETALAPTVPALVNELAPDALRGRYNGALALAFTTGFIAGPLLAGAAIASGFGTALPGALAAACALAALAARRLRRHLPLGLDAIPA